MENENSFLKSENTTILSELDSVKSENTTILSELDSVKSEINKTSSELEKISLRKKLIPYYKAYLEKDPNPEDLEWHIQAIQEGKLDFKSISNHFKSFLSFSFSINFGFLFLRLN